LPQPKNPFVLFSVCATAGKVVEGPVCHANDLLFDELCAFCRAGLGMLQAALPLKHGPSGIIVLRHLGKNRVEVDLPIAQRAKPAWPVDPGLVAAIHAAS